MDWDWLVWYCKYYYGLLIWVINLLFCRLGQFLHLQLKCPQLAYYWFLWLANQGDSFSQYYVGVLLVYEHKIKANYEQAYEWLLKAAEQDYNQAQLYLGLKFYQGLGTEVDYEQAYEWFAKAAANDHPEAMYYLSILYHCGEGVPANRQRAAKWCVEAAKHNLACAAYVAFSYYYEEQDFKQAYYWLTEALKRGFPNALTALATLEEDPEWQALQLELPSRGVMFKLPFNYCLILQWRGWRNTSDEDNV